MSNLDLISMTIEEFRATKKSMTWLEFAQLERIDPNYTNCPKVIVYADHFFIEDYEKNDLYDDGINKGRYVMIIDRNIFYDNNLEKLEQLLFNFVQDYAIE